MQHNPLIDPDFSPETREKFRQNTRQALAPSAVAERERERKKVLEELDLNLAEIQREGQWEEIFNARMRREFERTFG